MSSFPGSPKLVKGAIVGIDPFNPLASVIIFQYNPESMTRTLSPQGAGSGAYSEEALRLKGPPMESIKFEMEIDATDQLETAESNAVKMGIAPTLSALEMLLYPKSALIIANEVLKAVGIIETIPQETPLIVLIWGVNRVVPVKLTELSIVEKEFDTALNPIRATVNIGLQVLNYNDLGLVSVGGALFMSHQIIKETMAVIGSINNIN